MVALAALCTLWYVVLPHKPIVDFLFLVMLATVVLTGVLKSQYPVVHPKLRLDVLGQLMWIRTAAFVLLVIRRVDGIGFGFWPSRQDWITGAKYFGLLIPVAGLAAWAIRFTRPHFPIGPWYQILAIAVGTFFGILWVVALGEEFLFRGLLLQWSSQWLGGDVRGLALTSALFGVVHLWFRPFPNWRFAVVAAIAGVFYGLAFRRARSIQASMVTHALTVTAWTLFLR